MQAASASRLRRWTPNSPRAAALFRSAAVALVQRSMKSDSTGVGEDSSKAYVKFSVRQKRSDAKGALKNLLFGGSSKQSFQDGMTWRTDGERGRKFKADGSSHESVKDQRRDTRESTNGKGKHTRKHRWQNKHSFCNEDDYEHPQMNFTARFGGPKNFTWSFGSGESLQFENTTGFEWRDDSQQTRTRTRIWSESDIEEDEPKDISLQADRVTLGLPRTGLLKLDDVKCAFHSSALKWHPDKHQGPSKAIAEEKFKLCVAAYKSLCTALKPS